MKQSKKVLPRHSRSRVYGPTGAGGPEEGTRLAADEVPAIGEEIDVLVGVDLVASGGTRGSRSGSSSTRYFPKFVSLTRFYRARSADGGLVRQG